MSDDGPKTRTTDRLSNIMLTFDAVDRIEADLPEALKARGKIYQLDHTDAQLRAIARIAAQVAAQHIAWALDSATDALRPPTKIEPK